MKDIQKKIVTDEEGNPVAVQIEYADWLEIQDSLSKSQSGEGNEKDFDQILEESSGIWTKGDGLEYQQKIREEWDREWNKEEDE